MTINICSITIVTLFYRNIFSSVELPIGGFGQWNEWLPCNHKVKLKYRVCYGNSLNVCDGHGVQNGVQAVRETCNAEPILAYMEGNFFLKRTKCIKKLFFMLQRER